MSHPLGYVRTLDLSAVADADGLKTSFTDPTKATTYGWSDMNGAFKTVAEGFGGAGRTVSVTTGSKSGNFNASEPVVVSGLRGGKRTTENLSLAANGNETVSSVGAFEFPDPDFSVYVPAQGGGSTMQIGVQDVVAPVGGTFAGLRPLSSGNVVVSYQGGYSDTIAGLTTRDELVRAERIKASTAVGVKLFWDVFTRRG